MPTLPPTRSPRRRRKRSHSGSKDGATTPAAKAGPEHPEDGDVSDYPTTDVGSADEVATTKKVTLLTDQDSKKRWASWWRRVGWSLVMIGGFFALLFLMKQSGLVLLVIVIQANVYKELVGLATRESKEKELPGFKGFYIYWFICGMFFIYGRTLMPHLRYHNIQVVNWVLDRHGIICWSLYIVGLMAFVTSLKKRRLYRYQFKQFAFCHTAIVAIVFQSANLASNVFEGVIWFVLPSGMVVCNDCFAYIFGFFFGRTPLIRLSPKKTWEGFIGGFLATIVWGFFFARLIQQYDFMTCPQTGFGLSEACVAGRTTLSGLYALQPVSSYLSPALAEATPLFVQAWLVSPLQLHAIVMAIFASICAPFGGFFASGFKRAFKIKDFGDLIPGHGGFTDRMDCQIVMGLFVYVYFHNVVAFGGYGVESTFAKAIALPMEDQLALLQRLAGHLGKTVV